MLTQKQDERAAEARPEVNAVGAELEVRAEIWTRGQDLDRDLMLSSSIELSAICNYSDE